MNAEILREAATNIRENFTIRALRGDDQAAFMLAVAIVLENEADLAEDPYGSGTHRVRSDLLDLARTYLGRDA